MNGYFRTMLPAGILLAGCGEYDDAVDSPALSQKDSTQTHQDGPAWQSRPAGLRGAFAAARMKDAGEKRLSAWMGVEDGKSGWPLLVLLLAALLPAGRRSPGQRHGRR